MTIITTLARLIAGTTRNVDLSASGNILHVDQIKIGNASGTILDKTILDKLVNLQNGTDFSTGTDSHTHDGRYYTETELGSTTNGASGASKIGIDVTPVFSNFTPTANTVQGAIEGIDTALGNTADIKVKVSATDTTSGFLEDKINAGEGLTSTVTNPSGNAQLVFNVNTDNSTIEVDADIVRLKDGGITNAKVNASAAIAESKLALDYSTSSLNTDIGTRVVANSAITGATKTKITYDTKGLVTSGTDATAADIVNTPAGNIAATTVQAALNELDTEKLALAGGTMTGAIAMGSNKITGLANGTASNDAVNYGQLQAIANGQNWQAPLLDPDLVDDSLSTPPGSPVDNTTYLIGSSATGAWTGLEGRVVYYAAGTWHDILGRVVAIGDRFGITIEHGSGSEGGNMVGNHNKIAQVTTATPGSYAYSYHTPAQYDTVLVNDTLSQHFSHSYTYNSTSWVEVAGPGVITAGAALAFSGNTLNVQFDNTTIDLTGNLLEVKNGGITNAKVASGIDAVKIADGSVTNAEFQTLSDISTGSTIQSQIDGKVTKNANITGATKTKITYDAKGLVTAGTDATTADIADSTNKRYVTDAQLVVIGNTSGTNTGDQTITLTGDVTGSGTGSFATTIANSAVTTSKLNATSVTAAKLGSDVAGAGLSGGNGSALTVAYSPSIQAAAEVAGEALSATTLYAMRYGQNAETTGRMYKADLDTTTVDNFYVIGLVLTVGALSAADPMPNIVKSGLLTKSSHGFTVGKPVYLSASGALTSTAPTTALMAIVKVGVVKDANTIDVQIQVMGVN